MIEKLAHNHEYVFEILYHFNCGNEKCGKWWSYAKTPDNKEELHNLRKNIEYRLYSEFYNHNLAIRVIKDNEECGKWWSYAKTPNNKDEVYKQKVEAMTCPHCGTKGSLKIKDKFLKNI